MRWVRDLSDDFSTELISCDMAPLNLFRHQTTNDAKGNERVHEDIRNSGRKIRRFSVFCLGRLKNMSSRFMQCYRLQNSRCFFSSTSVERSVKRLKRAKRSNLTRNSLQTFCLTARVYLHTQKYGLFRSLKCIFVYSADLAWLDSESFSHEVKFY